MNYKQATDFMFSQLPMFQRKGKAAYKSNLDNTHRLDKYFGHPHRKFKSVHVAGTNGKGSVAHMLASILQNAGFKTGLYTSPHLKDFRERIKINGNMIPEYEVVDFVEKHAAIIKEVKPSFFEMTVAMAFDYFARQQVDIAIIEVGLGGRLDSTNIILPEVSIITNISFDHTEFLGNSLQSIAFEKSGIIKPQVPVVIGESQRETKDIFIDKASLLNSAVTFADKIYRIDYSTISPDGLQIFNVKSQRSEGYENLSIDLHGMYQKCNVITCLSAIDQLQSKGYTINRKHIYEGISRVGTATGLAGRWQVIGNNPLTVTDTAHNEEGIKQVVNQINTTAYKNLHIVFGMVNDKNIDKILTLLPNNAAYYFTKANIPRALNEIELMKQASKHQLTGKSFFQVADALENARKNAQPEDMIFVGGSTFIAAEVI